MRRQHQSEEPGLTVMDVGDAAAESQRDGEHEEMASTAYEVATTANSDGDQGKYSSIFSTISTLVFISYFV